MGLSPSPGTPSSVFRAGKTSQGGNDTLWENNLQSQIPALLVPAQGWGLTGSDTVPVLQGRGLRQGTLLRVGDRDWGHPAAPRGWAALSIPGAAGVSVLALTNPSPRVSSPWVRTRGTSADLRGEPSQAAVQFCPGTPVTPRVVAGSSGEGAGRLHALPFDCGDLRQAGAGGPRAGRAGDVPAPPAGARSCRPGTSVIFIRGKTMSIIYPQHFPCRWGADLGCR